VPDKEESKAKIDGVLSTVNALGRAMLALPAPAGLGAEFF